jgi:hypothetical protein
LGLRSSFAEQCLMPLDSKNRVDKAAAVERLSVFANEYLERTGDGGTSVGAGIIIPDLIRLNYGQGQSNPMEHVGFFSRLDTVEDPAGASQSAGSSIKAFPIPKESVSALLPSMFEENTFRVFCRSQDPIILRAVRFAFERWVRAYVPSLARDSRLSSLDDSIAESPPSSPPRRPASSPFATGSAPPTTYASKARAPVRGILPEIHELETKGRDSDALFSTDDDEAKDDNEDDFMPSKRSRQGNSQVSSSKRVALASE